MDRDLRMRLAVSGFVLVASPLTARFAFDADWWLAFVLGTLLAAFYALPPERQWGRAGMATSVGAVVALAGWFVADLGSWSFAVAVVAAVSFLAYTALESRRSGEGVNG